MRWLPLLLLLAATPFLVRAGSVVALAGPSALRELFPFAVLLQAHTPQTLGNAQSEAVNQALLWIQFPLYGLMAVAIGGTVGVLRACGAVALLHAVAVGAAFLFA